VIIEFDWRNTESGAKAKHRDTVENLAALESWVNPNVASNGIVVFADGQACTVSIFGGIRAAGEFDPGLRAVEFLMFSNVWLAKQARNAEKIRFR
jgi:hypothetical protein